MKNEKLQVGDLVTVSHRNNQRDFDGFVKEFGFVMEMTEQGYACKIYYFSSRLQEEWVPSLSVNKTTKA